MSRQPPNAEQDSGAQGRLWRVTAVLAVPKHAPAAPGGALPERLEFYSRLAEQTRTYGDITVAIRKTTAEAYASLYGNNPQVELLHFVADVPTDGDDMAALEKLGPVFEATVDLMSFEMGAGLGVGQLTVVDISPPVAVGDERASNVFTTSPFDTHARAVDMGAVRGLIHGQLPDSLAVGDSKTAAVLRWFVKALGRDLLHDQFIFLWIALEILADESEVMVEEPYTNRCGHEIASCPECGTPTALMVRGATLRAFLQACGVSEEQSRDLWRMRQLMHGAIPFDSGKLAGLGGLVQPLRAVVAAGLKARLGKSPTDPPIVAAAGMSIHPAMGLGGTGQITQSDIEPLAHHA